MPLTDRNLHTHNHISLISCSGYNFFCCPCLCEGSIYIFGKPSDISKSYVDKILHIWVIRWRLLYYVYVVCTASKFYCQPWKWVVQQTVYCKPVDHHLHTCTCATYTSWMWLLAIWGQNLFPSELPVVWLLFEGGVYCGILGWRLRTNTCSTGLLTCFQYWV